MRTRRIAVFFVAAIASLLSFRGSVVAQIDLAQRVREQSGLDRGVCVLLGEGLGGTATTLAKQTDFIVFLQSADAADALEARQAAYDAGFLGSRVFVQTGDWSRINLADHLADVVVVHGSARGTNGVRRAELLRVVQPRGKLIDRDEVTEKPVPAGTGEWSHPYHGADNNPQSEDSLARAPYLTQFLATPWYGPMPEITLSSGGRLFKAFGHLAFKQREWPMLGKLIAMNAYNGQQLWQRDLKPGFMIHRNTIVAAPDILYLGDDESCKLIDAASGALIDEIVVPEGISDGPVWKWMTLSNGVLYALVGEQERLHPVFRGTRSETGWPWTTVKSTYGDYQDTWGFGRTLLAIDPRTKRIIWSHREPEPIDSRATCMFGDRIFVYSHPNYLAAVDASSGEPIWRTSDPALLAVVGDHDPAQTARLGYATSAYMKCNGDALYFAGPQRRKLVAVSARDGKLLWTYDDGNVQLVLRDDGLYAMGRMTNSKKFDYLTGKVLADLECFRGNCTRATGAADSIFARGYRHTGTLRYDIAYQQPRRLPAMRPACQDGVVVANGSLYWGPWMCDCNHSLVGVISLASAGDFQFEDTATNEARLDVADVDPLAVAPLPVTPADWPTYRANNRRTASVPVSVAGRAKSSWEFQQPARVSSTAPVAAGGLVFLSGSDGVIHALDARNGGERWSAFTGGDVRYPPAVWNSRLFVGSGDGWIYAFEAGTGRQLWRFQAAPVERMIPVYGRLASTWPVASGVIVDEGVAYAAAGIVSHDGTHVYALDAVTGQIKWQNNTSANLFGENEVVGVSVQGHLLLDGQRLYLAGGNVVSPAVYDLETGTCLNTLPQQPDQTLDDHWQQQRSSRGSELYLVEGQVVAGGPMLYSPASDGPPSRYNANYLLQAAEQDLVIQGNNQIVMRIDPRRDADGKATVIWQDNKRFAVIDGLAIGQNAVLVAGRSAGSSPESEGDPTLVAFDPKDGSLLWSHPLPARAVRWGIALDREGRVLVSLTDGRLLCLAN